MTDNITVLTQSHSAVAPKKRVKHARVKEIVFDEEARKSFLTGFHKRKVARREQAKKKAQLREKQERLETRREHRRALAERAARNAAEVEKAYGALADGDGDKWRGVTSDRETVEEEYEGEEQLATVTVVQDIDLSALMDGPPGPPPTRGSAPGSGRGREQGKVKAVFHAEQRKGRRTDKAGQAGRKRK